MAKRIVVAGTGNGSTITEEDLPSQPSAVSGRRNPNYKCDVFDPADKYFLRHIQAKTPITFVCYHAEITGIIVHNRIYDLALTDRKKMISKTSVLYLYNPDIQDVLENLRREDESVSLGVPYKAFERNVIPDETLKGHFENHTRVAVTMRNGHVFSGNIHSHGKYSIRLELAENTRVILMRHSVFNITGA